MPFPFIIGGAIIAAVTGGAAYVINESNKEDERRARERAEKEEKALKAAIRHREKEAFSSKLSKLKSEYGYNDNAETRRKTLVENFRMINGIGSANSEISQKISLSIKDANLAKAKLNQLIEEGELVK